MHVGKALRTYRLDVINRIKNREHNGKRRPVRCVVFSIQVHLDGISGAVASIRFGQ